jgi:hypothetical protein
MKRSIIAALLCLTALGGCARQLTPNPITPVPVIVVPKPPADIRRTDLPFNWFEVTRDNWSYGLPIGFDRITIGIPNTSLMQHYSLEQEISINFTKHNSSLTMEDFVTKFVADIKEKNGLVLAVAHSTNADRPITAVHYLTDILSIVGVGAAPAQGSLDFFLQKDTTIYHMSCFGDALKLKAEAETCFDVASTLVIK